MLLLVLLCGVVHADGDPAKTYAKASALIQRGRTRDAMPYLRDAAEHGFATAQFVLGETLLEGAPGVKKDPVEAVTWFEKAVAQHNRAAQYQLGGMYEEGEGGLARDWKKAAELYLASAEQGFAQAQFAYGLTCEFQLADRKQAIKWLEAAGRQGEGRAGWIAQWLRRPDLPHFKDEAQLGAYINQTIAAWMHSNTPKDDTSIGEYQRQRTKMFYEQGDKAAGDRCKYNGSCY